MSFNNIILYYIFIFIITGKDRSEAPVRLFYSSGQQKEIRDAALVHCWNPTDDFRVKCPDQQEVYRSQRRTQWVFSSLPLGAAVADRDTPRAGRVNRNRKIAAGQTISRQ